MTIHYTDASGRDRYIDDLRAQFRTALSAILERHRSMDGAIGDFEVVQRQNGQRLGTIWLLPLKSPQETPVFVSVTEKLFRDRHQVTATLVGCQFIPGEQTRASRWLLSENGRLPLGVRYAAQGLAIATLYVLEQTQYVSPPILVNLLERVVSAGITLPARMAAAGVPVAPLDSGRFSVELVDADAIPERLKPYVDRYN